MPIGAVIGGLGVAASVATGIMGANAAESAAETQAAAADRATATQLQMYERTRNDLSPFINMGSDIIPILQRLTGTGPGGDPGKASLTSAYRPNFNVTREMIEQDPGYQFLLNEGLEQAQSGFAARGLANSGESIKGAIRYAMGLADTTQKDVIQRERLRQQQMFQNEMETDKTTFDMINQLLTLSGNAAAGAGTQATATGRGMAESIMGAGNASAAGTIASNNALAGIPGNALQSWMMADILYPKQPPTVPEFDTQAYYDMGNSATKMLNNANLTAGMRF